MDTDLIGAAKDSFATLSNSGQLLPLLRLLFGHPLWLVAETAASAVAGLVREAKSEQKNRKAKAYIRTTAELFGKDLPWRVRYGAAETACQFRLEDEPKHATFFKSVQLFYNDPISKLRGLSAENLFFVLLNASDKQRAEYEKKFEREILTWLMDEDCWVLEHIYRYFNSLYKRNANIDRFTRAERSPLLAGLEEWWKADRETFLEHIEAAKEISRQTVT